MAVSHKDLTGTDLHEIKGASTATSGQVPVSNGAGGAPFGTLTHTSLSTTGNPFGAQLLHVREEQSSGVNSTTTATHGGQNVQVLNTVKTNEISGASLASNTITLPAGTYHIEARTCAYAYAVPSAFAGGGKARLRNTTAGTTTLSGSGQAFLNGAAAPIYPPGPPFFVNGRFTIAGSTNFQLQCYVVNSSGAGSALGTGDVEVYAEVMIWKVA